MEKVRSAGEGEEERGRGEKGGKGGRRRTPTRKGKALPTVFAIASRERGREGGKVLFRRSSHPPSSNYYLLLDDTRAIKGEKGKEKKGKGGNFVGDGTDLHQRHLLLYLKCPKSPKSFERRRKGEGQSRENFSFNDWREKEKVQGKGIICHQTGKKKGGKEKRKGHFNPNLPNPGIIVTRRGRGGGIRST